MNSANSTTIFNDDPATDQELVFNNFVKQAFVVAFIMATASVGLIMYGAAV